MSDFLDGMVGKRVPGGCDSCSAVQVMSRDESGVYHLEVRHDDTCPALARIEGRRNR